MALVRDVVGYEGMYSVTDEGDVISNRRVIDNGRGEYVRESVVLKPGYRDGGYQMVVLFKDGVGKSASVHRLVAEAFIPNPDNLPEINHKDENPANNRVENLEWCTRQYNIEYSKAKRVAQFDKDGEKLAEYRSISVAADMTGIGRTSINNALSGWSRTAGGYVWKYVD